MTAKPLRVVGEGDRARPLSVLEAAESGDYLAELLAMRRRIAKSISDEKTPARDLAALTRRQLEISKEIRALQAEDRGDEVGNAAATPDEKWTAT